MPLGTGSVTDRQAKFPRLHRQIRPGMPSTILVEQVDVDSEAQNRLSTLVWTCKVR